MKITKLFLLALLPSIGLADNVVLPIADQGQYLGNIERPSKGATQRDVRQQYGEPQKVSEPSGEPPISRWSYEDFSVYFEGDTVIHSVLKHRRQDQLNQQ